MIRLHQDERAFHTKAGPHFVLRSIGLAIERGEFVAVTDPSGAGKSTLLTILGMFDADPNAAYGHRVVRLLYGRVEG